MSVTQNKIMEYVCYTIHKCQLHVVHINQKRDWIQTKSNYPEPGNGLFGHTDAWDYQTSFTKMKGPPTKTVITFCCGFKL